MPVAAAGEDAMTIVVLGAAHWDVIACAGAELGPGDDVPGTIRRRIGGVAANVAVALAGLGRRPRLIAAMGRDAEGEALAAALAARGIETEHLVLGERTDGYVLVEDAGGELFAAVADCRALEAAGPALLAPLSGTTPEAVVADGNLAAATIERLVALPLPAATPLALVPASPAKADRLAPALAAGRGRLYVNRREAERLAGRGFDDSGTAALALVALGAEAAVVTDGPRPATAADRSGAVSRAPAAASGSVSGAGDVFVAAHLDAMLRGVAPGDALGAALAAATAHLGAGR
jgi:pseudouridine kinase